jgi:hypothetical protein
MSNLADGYAVKNARIAVELYSNGRMLTTAFSDNLTVYAK